MRLELLSELELQEINQHFLTSQYCEFSSTVMVGAQFSSLEPPAECEWRVFEMSVFCWSWSNFIFTVCNGVPVPVADLGQSLK